MKSTAVFDSQAHCALLTFKGFLTTKEFIAIADQAHDLRIKHRSNRQLNNIEDMAVLTQEIQTWLGNVWFPKAVETGLKYFAFVIPKNALGMMSMKNANKDADHKTGIEIKYFDNEPEAKQWLNSK
jgi:hypothetical protein